MVRYMFLTKGYPRASLSLAGVTVANKRTHLNGAEVLMEPELYAMPVVYTTLRPNGNVIWKVAQVGLSRRRDVAERMNE